MNKIKIIALALSAAIFTGCTAGCNKNNVSDKNKSSDKISSDTNDPTETPSHAAGELITPPESLSLRRRIPKSMTSAHIVSATAE